jgi:glutamate dehydrogenase (NAD(P)+)
VVPDFIANAGGVICAAMEYQGATESAAFDTIRDKLRRNTELVLEESKRTGCLPREASVHLALARVRKAMDWREYGIFSKAPGFI